jgi:hypothetical protein
MLAGRKGSGKAHEIYSFVAGVLDVGVTPVLSPLVAAALQEGSCQVTPKAFVAGGQVLLRESHTANEQLSGKEC